MKHLYCKRAFTLVEVVAAVAIFAIGALALYRLQSASVLSNSQTYRLTQATTLGQERMESFMAVGYDDTSLADADDDGLDTDADPNDGVDNNTADGVNFGLDDTVDTSGNITADGSQTSGMYTVYWNIADNQPIPNCKMIRVIVAWQLSGDTSHSVGLAFTRARFSR